MPGPLTHRIKVRIFGCVGYYLIQGICRSNRFSVSGLESIRESVQQGHNIFALWHSRLFYLVYFYCRHVRTPQASILISLSRDGDYGQALVSRFKQDAVRGSSSRGGAKAAWALASRLAAGKNLALTPDGPRGPAFQVQNGIVRLAQVTGSTIVPVSYDASRKWTLKSWDRFILPKPFGRIHMAIGEPIRVPSHASAEEVKLYCQKLQDALTELDARCAEKVKDPKA
jgi:lysophospholipid acyltransferase (LPLAT)-like uncharacterized protein